MKVLLLCLDGLNPDLAYQWRDELPNFDKIMDSGAYGYIDSTHPPITPQAWTVVRSGQNPGKFGYWDFRYREDYSYIEDVRVNSAKPLKHVDTLDTILPKLGKKVGMLNVPVTYPPLEIPNGFCISSFMTPGEEYEYTYPSYLRILIRTMFDEYFFDASTRDQNFRVIPKDRVLARIYMMDDQKFKLLSHFIRERKYDYIMTVIMGTDRMPHLFWHYMDPEHIRYDPDSKYKDALKNHYKFCDEWVGKLLKEADEEMNLLLLSDHSVHRLDGRININEWFVENDYLKLKEKPRKLTSFRDLKINWEESIAWGSGYQGQIFLNVKGKEEKGFVEPDEYDDMLDQLIKDLENIPYKEGKKLDTKIVKRKDVYYGPLAKFAPDLFTYFGKMHWAISPLVGHGSNYSYDTALGSDDGVHGPQGFFMMAGPDIPKMGEIRAKPEPWTPPEKDFSLLDIAPTILHLMGIEVPEEMEGRDLIPS